ncbi:MAG: hypothetical protein LBB21_00690 [Holosporaceae bacterium]|jgi:hypothetical protein|nr:hypothetical protein [Holosporaceae bacterium]
MKNKNDKIMLGIEDKKLKFEVGKRENVMKKTGFWKVALAVVAVAVEIAVFRPSEAMFAIPPATVARYNTTTGDFGLLAVANVNELLLWIDNFYVAMGPKAPAEMEALIQKADNINAIIRICYGTTTPSKIPDAIRKYTINEIITANCGQRDDLKRTVMTLHICYHNTVCGGDVLKIVKLFLCTPLVPFGGGFANVGAARAAFSQSELNHIILTRRSFLQHIQKHWIDCSVGVAPLILTAVQLNAIYGKKSGFVAYSAVPAMLIAAESAIDDLVVAHDLSSLKILVNNGRELTISTKEGLSPGEPVMFKMDRKKFSRNISSIFAIERSGQAAALVPITLPVNITQNVVNSVRRINTFGTLGAEEITFKSEQQVKLKFFFKFTIPHNIQPLIVGALNAPINFALAPISNRINNMGSFYVRN